MIIGLTGGIASGKSTVSKMLKELGFPIVDADVIARKVVEPNEEAYKQIVAYFGDEIINEDKTIQRKKLGAIIFNDESKRYALNEIVHPAIRKQMLAEKEMYEREGHETIIFDIPLLFEGDSKYLVDKKLLVYVDEKTQLERLLARDQTTIEDAKSRIASQMPLKDKVALADAVVNNNGTMEETKEQLLKVLQDWGLI